MDLTKSEQSPLAQEPSGPSATLLGSMHDELLPLAEAIVGYAQILSDDAADRPEDCVADIAKMLEAAHSLHHFIKYDLKLTSADALDASIDDQMGVLRHDVGNHFNQVFGFCQLLLLDEDDRFFGAFSADLTKIREICEQGNVILLGYKNSPTSAAPAEPAPTIETRPVLSEPTTAELASNAKLVEPATVLVIDDNPSSRDVMVRILQREGHTVVEASGGREALEILAEKEFDLVLLDFLMPEMNGYQVLQAIKAEERLRHTPVIIVSALDTIHEVVACIEIGAEDFLNKPVDLLCSAPGEFVFGKEATARTRIRPAFYAGTGSPLCPPSRNPQNGIRSGSQHPVLRHPPFQPHQREARAERNGCLAERLHGRPVGLRDPKSRRAGGLHWRRVDGDVGST